MERITINDQKYAVQVHQRNEGLPQLLMLHGFMGDHRAFDHLIDDLSNFSNPIGIDLLGHGASSKPTDPSRHHETNQVNDIINIIQTKSLNPLFLYGYSMGGRLALKTALHKPSLFNGLILESTNCGISAPKKRKERRHIDAARAQKIEEDFEQFLADWSKLDLFKSPTTVDQILSQKYQNIQFEQSPKALSASLQGFGTGNMSSVCDQLSALNLPTLLLAGSADKKYQQINQYLVEQLPNATFSSITAGHRVHLDNPANFIKTIHEFLSKF